MLSISAEGNGIHEFPPLHLRCGFSYPSRRGVEERRGNLAP